MYNGAMTQVELLAPAKDLAGGIVAIDSGADAVYIGAARFGARARVGNSLDDIAALYVRERFSPGGAPDASTQARAAWQAARPHLLRRALRRFLRSRSPFKQ